MTRAADAIDLSAIARRLGSYWAAAKPLGEDSWVIDGSHRRVIISIDLSTEPGVPWIHASISYKNAAFMPSYRDLKQLHEAVFGDGHAYQCFVPADEHVNIKGWMTLHLWGRLDGKPVLPNFGREGHI